MSSNYLFSPEIRWSAALCNWSGALWLPTSLFLIIILPNLFNYFPLSINFIILPIASMLLSLPIQWIAWIILKPTSKLIDLCGREAVDCSSKMLATLFLLLAISTIMYLLNNGLGGVGYQSPKTHVFIFMNGFVFTPAILMYHLFFTYKSGAMALKGKHFTSKGNRIIN
jgi:uncharacterized Tic20 family protein